MKGIFLGSLGVVLTCTTVFSQTRGEYDLDLYQKRLVMTPKVEIGLFNDQAPATFGLDADYFLFEKLQAQVKLCLGKELHKQELGGIYLFQNEIKLQKADVFSKTIAQTDKGEVYEVIKKDVSFHKMKGFRGGFFRFSKLQLNVLDAQEIGFDGSEVTRIQGGTETKYSLAEYATETIGLADFNYGISGVYAGLYIYNSRNSTNVDKDTRMMAKGRKNYGFGINFDVLAGYGNIKSNETIKVNQKGGFGLGGRVNFEYSYFIGKNHTSAFFTNIEFGKYPKTVGIAAMWGLGFRTSFMDKIVSN